LPLEIGWLMHPGGAVIRGAHLGHPPLEFIERVEFRRVLHGLVPEAARGLPVQENRGLQTTLGLGPAEGVGTAERTLRFLLDSRLLRPWSHPLWPGGPAAFAVPSRPGIPGLALVTFPRSPGTHVSSSGGRSERFSQLWTNPSSRR